MYTKIKKITRLDGSPKSEILRRNLLHRLRRNFIAHCSQKLKQDTPAFLSLLRFLYFCFSIKGKSKNKRGSFFELIQYGLKKQLL